MYISQLKRQKNYLSSPIPKEQVFVVEFAKFNDEFYIFILNQQLKICNENLGFSFFQTKKVLPEFSGSTAKQDFSLNFPPANFKKKKDPRYFLFFPVRGEFQKNQNRVNEKFIVSFYFSHLYVLFLQESLFFHQFFYFQTKFSFFEWNFSKSFCCIEKKYPISTFFIKVEEAKGQNTSQKSLLFFFDEQSFRQRIFQSKTLFVPKKSFEISPKQLIFLSWSFHSFLFSFFFKQKKQLSFFSFSESMKLFLKKVGYWERKSEKNTSLNWGNSPLKIQTLLKILKKNRISKTLSKKKGLSFVWKSFFETNMNKLQEFFLFLKFKSILSKSMLILFFNPKLEAHTSSLNFQSNFQYSIHPCILAFYQEFSCSYRSSFHKKKFNQEISPKFLGKFHFSEFSYQTEQQGFQEFMQEKNALNFLKFLFFLQFFEEFRVDSMLIRKETPFQNNPLQNYQTGSLESLFSISKNKKIFQTLKTFLALEKKERLNFQSFQRIEENILKMLVQLSFQNLEKEIFYSFLDQKFAMVKKYQYHPLKKTFFKFFKKTFHKKIQILQEVFIGYSLGGSFDFYRFQFFDSFFSIFFRKSGLWKSIRIQFRYLLKSNFQLKVPLILIQRYLKKYNQEKKSLLSILEKNVDAVFVHSFTGIEKMNLRKIYSQEKDFQILFQNCLKRQIFQYDFQVLFLTEKQFIFQKFWVSFHQWLLKKIQSMRCIEENAFANLTFLGNQTALLNENILQKVKFSHSSFSFMGENPGVDFLGFSFIHYSLLFSIQQSQSSFNFMFKKKDQDVSVFNLVKDTETYRYLIMNPQILKSLHYPKKTILKPILFPSKFQTLQYLNFLKQIFKKNKAQSQEILIQKLRPLILNWCFYFRNVSNQKIFSFCDFILFKWLWKWCCRRHSKKSQLWIRKKYFLSLKNVFSISFFLDEDFENEQNKPKKLNFLQLRNTEGSKIQNCFFCCLSKKQSFSCLPSHMFIRKIFFTPDRVRNPLNYDFRFSQYFYFNENRNICLTD